METQKMLLSKLNEVYKGQKGRLAYKAIVDVIAGHNHSGLVELPNVIRYYLKYGGGNFIKIVNYGDEVVEILKAMGISYTIGNDAPKGGKLGKYIRVDI